MGGTPAHRGISAPRLPPFRHVPPVHSPLPLSAVWRAVVDGTDPRPRLHELLSDRFAADAVLLCDSGTTALRLAMGGGSPVALPAFGCFDLVTAALGADVDVRFYDVDPETLGPDFTSLERVLGEGARTIVAAHLYGIPVDWGRLTELARRFDATVVEDAAMGHGARWDGRPLGSLGELAVLSFGRGKGWTGVGGGALLARGAAASRVRALPGLQRAGGALGAVRTVTAAVGQAAFDSPTMYGIPAGLPGLRLGETVYHPPSAPSEMTALSAGVALRTAPHADREGRARRALAERYRTAVAPGPEAGPGARTGTEPRVSHITTPEPGVTGALRYPILVSGGRRALGREGPVRRLGIETSYPRVLPDLEAAARWGRGDGAEWPGARRLVRELVTLPTHSGVTEDDFARIVDLMQTVARK